MTLVGLIRHFPTDWNGEGRLQGRADRPLTGAARARLAGLVLPCPWDRARIVASPLARARETAGILADGRAVALDPRLEEQSWGAWEGHRPAELLADPGSGFVLTHLMPPALRPPGGESAEDVLARVLPALAEHGAGPGPVLVVTHKAVMRHVLGIAAAAGTGAGEPAEIKRARIYPLRLDAAGRPVPAGHPVRLPARR